MWGTKQGPTVMFFLCYSPKANSQVDFRSPMAGQQWNIYRWGIKLSSTTLFYLFSCHKVISLAKLKILLITPSHRAMPLALWWGTIFR